MLVVLGLVWLWRRPQLRPLALTSAAPSVVFGLEQGRAYYALPAMLPALVAGCLALAERRPRRVTLAGLGVLHVAVLALALPLVVPILPTRQLVSTGTWDKSFWKDEIGWHELVAQTAAAWRSRTPAERAAGAIVAGNYGVAGALSLYGPAAGLPTPVSGHLSFQYWHPAKMPQRTVLLVGFDREDALRRCAHATRPRGRRQPLAHRQRRARPADRLVPAARAARAAVGEHVCDCAVVTRPSGTRGACHLAGARPRGAVPSNNPSGTRGACHLAALRRRRQSRRETPR